jgi:hypothetical protein
MFKQNRAPKEEPVGELVITPREAIIVSDHFGRQQKHTAAKIAALQSP